MASQFYLQRSTSLRRCAMRSLASLSRNRTSDAGKIGVTSSTDFFNKIGQQQTFIASIRSPRQRERAASGAKPWSSQALVVSSLGRLKPWPPQAWSSSSSRCASEPTHRALRPLDRSASRPRRAASPTQSVPNASTRSRRRQKTVRMRRRSG